LLQNGISHFVFRFSQFSEIALESYNLRRRKTDFSERGSALKGFINLKAHIENHLGNFETNI